MTDIVRSVQIEFSTLLKKGASAAFQDMEGASARARAKVASDQQAIARSAEEGAAKAKRAQDGAAANAMRDSVLEATAYANAAKKRSIEEGKAFDERLKRSQKEKAQFDRDIAARIREVQRETAAIIREEERREAAAKRTKERQGSAFAKSGVQFASSTFSTMGAMASRTMGFGKEILSGMGVNFDIGSSVSKRLGLGETIQDIINQAKIAGQDVGPNAKARLTTAVDKVSDTSGLDPTRTAAVLSEMQAKSSDLQGALLALPDLGKLASAAKADMGDLGKAAGMVNAQLTNMEEFKGPANAEKRAQALMDIMRHITKQTADGSVEMSDYARYVGRVASAAQNFAGGFEKNIGTLGALSQLAMRGGATSASEATNASANLARDLMKNKNLKNWDAAGINLFADKGKTQIRGMDEIIVDYLRKFGGDKAAMAKMFPSSSSARAIKGAVAVYNDAGGGEKGIEAVKAELAKFSATISQAQVNELAKEKENSPAAKAQRFQNQLDKIVGSMAEHLIPVFEKLAPKALEVVEALSKMIEWGADHPGTAILAAITASIGKAAIGAGISKLLEGMLKKTFEGTDGKAAGVTGEFGKLLGGLAIAAAIFTIGKATIDVISSQTDKGVNDSEDRDAQIQNAIAKARTAAKTGEGKMEAMQELEALIGGQKARMEAAADPTGVFGAINPFSSKTFEDRSREQTDAEKLNVPGEGNLLQAQLNKMTATLESLKSGLKVEVTNMPAGGLAPPPQNGRVGVGG